MNETKKASAAVYIAPVLYVLCMYLLPVMVGVLSNSQDSSDSGAVSGILLLLPVILGLVNLVIVLAMKEKISRVQLLNCTRIIKYGLIPFYVIGGIVIALALLLMFTPVVIMVFVGPMIAILFSVIGWLGLLGAAPFSIAYIVRACKEKVHGKTLSVFAAIFQFFFSLDVLFVIILSIKDRIYRKNHRL